MGVRDMAGVLSLHALCLILAIAFWACCKLQPQPRRDNMDEPGPSRTEYNIGAQIITHTMFFFFFFWGGGAPYDYSIIYLKTLF